MFFMRLKTRSFLQKIQDEGREKRDKSEHIVGALKLA